MECAAINLGRGSMLGTAFRRSVLQPIAPAVVLKRLPGLVIPPFPTSPACWTSTRASLQRIVSVHAASGALSNAQVQAEPPASAEPESQGWFSGLLKLVFSALVLAILAATAYIWGQPAAPLLESLPPAVISKIHAWGLQPFAAMLTQQQGLALAGAVVAFFATICGPVLTLSHSKRTGTSSQTAATQGITLETASAKQSEAAAAVKAAATSVAQTPEAAPAAPAAAPASSNGVVSKAASLNGTHSGDLAATQRLQNLPAARAAVLAGGSVNSVAVKQADKPTLPSSNSTAGVRDPPYGDGRGVITYTQAELAAASFRPKLTPAEPSSDATSKTSNAAEAAKVAAVTSAAKAVEHVIAKPAAANAANTSPAATAAAPEPPKPATATAAVHPFSRQPTPAPAAVADIMPTPPPVSPVARGGYSRDSNLNGVPAEPVKESNSSTAADAVPSRGGGSSRGLSPSPSPLTDGGDTSVSKPSSKPQARPSGGAGRSASPSPSTDTDAALKADGKSHSKGVEPGVALVLAALMLVDTGRDAARYVKYSVYPKLKDKLAINLNQEDK